MSTFVKRIKDQRGVTLIELLAVIVILGIIAAIAVPAVMSNFDKAKTETDKQSQAIIIDAAKRYVLGENIKLVFTSNKAEILVADLVKKGYLDQANIKSQVTGKEYEKVVIDQDSTDTNKLSYSVTEKS